MSKSMIRFVNCLKFVLILIFLGGCAGSKKGGLADTNNTGIRNFELMREEFDPLSLDDDDIRIEQTIETDGDVDEIFLDSEEALTDSVVTGYRVQLIQTTDPEEVRNVQKDAFLQFDHGVYRVFDPPFYKVRVGDFAEWRHAENLQREALKRGYREAWVIRTKVNLRHAAKGANDM